MYSEPFGADIEFHRHNGVLAIRPGPTGRLRSLVKLTKEDEGERPRQRVWLFANAHVSAGLRGNERIDHVMRGVICGSLQEGLEFLERCRTREELEVVDVGMRVPCSNGYAFESRCTLDRFVQIVQDFTLLELEMVRWDFPNELLLRAILEGLFVSWSALGFTIERNALVSGQWVATLLVDGRYQEDLLQSEEFGRLEAQAFDVGLLFARKHEYVTLESTVFGHAMQCADAWINTTSLIPGSGEGGVSGHVVGSTC